MKAIKWLDEHFEEAIMVLLLVLIACVELIQVIVRNLPFIPALTWAEEFCRFCWIWSVFVSLPYTIRRGSMLRVSVLLDLFPPKVRNIINILVDLITGGAMLLLGWHAVGVVRSIYLSGETSPAMLWPMWIVYSIMLLGFFLGVLRSLQQAYIHIRSFNTDTMSSLEQTMAEAAEEAEAARLAEGIDTEGGDA
ncbi:MAG: TRAP transporter small permease [Oscillospiraceae bacterium]